MGPALARSSSDGGKLLVYACIGGEGDDLRGQYVTDMGTREPADFVIDEQGAEVQRRLWVSRFRLQSLFCPRLTGTAVGGDHGDYLQGFSRGSGHHW
jgi:hypothetical protein